jgi:hypothetical protein
MTHPISLAEAVSRLAAATGIPGHVTTGVSPDGNEVTLRRADGAAITMRAAEPARPDFLHIDVLPDAPLESIGRREGFAVLRTGEVFRLRDPEAFAAFWSAVELERDPVALAQLLALYQGTGEAFERHQNLAITTADFEGALAPETAEAIPGFIELTVDEVASTLAFCTFFIAPEPSDGSPHPGLNRWDASWSNGERRWEARPLARGLPSPRYGGFEDGH